MPFGHLTPPMLVALRPLVAGRIVHDLGAGDLGLARALRGLGASRVVAIDKAYGSPESPLARDALGGTAGIELVRAYFRDFSDPVDVAFVSWPVNWPTGLAGILERSRVVLYLGKNTDGSACGTPEVFARLASREVLAHVPHRRNTLVAYGPVRTARPLLGEELAALSFAPEREISYEEAEASEGAAAKGDKVAQG